MMPKLAPRVKEGRESVWCTRHTQRRGREREERESLGVMPRVIERFGLYREKKESPRVVFRVMFSLCVPCVCIQP